MHIDFTNPHVADPAWLWVALAAPLVLVLLQLHASRARRRELARLASPGALAVMSRSHSPGRRIIKIVLQTALLFSIGVALARPQWGEQTEKSESLGEDVLFLLDCSQSMLAADVNPSRLARSKLAIQEFVQNFGRGRVGLVAFAGQAFSWLIIGLTFLITYEVYTRYALDAPHAWAFDIMLQMYGTLFMMAGAYTLSKNGMVRGDVLYGFLPTRVQAALDLTLYLLFFIPGVTALCWAGLEYCGDSWRMLEHSSITASGPPVYPFKTIIPLAGSGRPRTATSAR